MAATTHAGLRSAYLLLYYGGLAVLVLGLVLYARTEDIASLLLIVIGCCLVVAAQVCAGILLYSAWKCVERHRERLERGHRIVDPGAAIALTFIPLVNVVGAYFSLGRLPGDLNALARSSGLHSRMPSALGYAVAIMLTCALIPLLGPFIAAVGALTCMPPLFFMSSRLVDEIEARLAVPNPPAS